MYCKQLPHWSNRPIVLLYQYLCITGSFIISFVHDTMSSWKSDNKLSPYINYFTYNFRSTNEPISLTRRRCSALPHFYTADYKAQLEQLYTVAYIQRGSCLKPPLEFHAATWTSKVTLPPASVRTFFWST